jgi:hypothetical protein
MVRLVRLRFLCECPGEWHVEGDVEFPITDVKALTSYCEEFFVRMMQVC